MQIRNFLKRSFRYIRNIVLTDIVIGLIVALTFLFFGKFSFLAYSERMFYAGIVMILLGGVVGFAVMFSGRSFGIPVLIRKPEEAKRLLEHYDEYREEIEKRYDASILIWLVGLGCILFSALVEIFLA